MAESRSRKGKVCQYAGQQAKTFRGRAVGGQQQAVSEIQPDHPDAAQGLWISDEMQVPEYGGPRFRNCDQIWTMYVVHPYRYRHQVSSDQRSTCLISIHSTQLTGKSPETSKSPYERKAAISGQSPRFQQSEKNLRHLCSAVRSQQFENQISNGQW